MKILFALTYYRPHLSGLTVFAARLAEALAARGHVLTVLTSQHTPQLPRDEIVEGVSVVRVPVALRVGKGALMPSYARRARTLLREHELVVIHLPATPAETMVLPILARFGSRRPVVSIHYCDVRLPGRLFARALDRAVYLSNRAAVALSDRVVTLTEDYARHSPLLRAARGKLDVIAPAALAEEAPPAEVVEFRRRHAPDGERLVGVAARLAAEKGVEYLLAALPRLRERLGPVKILFTGEQRAGIGEEKYLRRLNPLLEECGGACEFLGALDWRKLAVFYAACDVTALPSTNSTEAFGLAQLESMLSGTPVVASDLPGVRACVERTGMGLTVRPRDPLALADAIAEVVGNRARYVRPRAEIEALFSFDEMVRSYEKLFEGVVAPRRGGGFG